MRDTLIKQTGGIVKFACANARLDCDAGKDIALGMAAAHRLIMRLSGLEVGECRGVLRLAKGGEITRAGCYSGRIDFAFAPAFQAEARLRIAAEWQPQDMVGTRALVENGRLYLGGLISTRRPAAQALDAYPQAFTDPDCLKMILDWSNA